MDVYRDRGLIKNMDNEFLTLFYMKRNGKIMGFCTGKQDLNFYGDLKEDYELIMDFIIVHNDNFIIDNRDHFKVIDGELIFTKQLTF